MCVGSPTAGTWSSSQWRPDNEFETHTVASGSRSWRSVCDDRMSDNVGQLPKPRHRGGKRVGAAAGPQSHPRQGSVSSASVRG